MIAKLTLLLLVTLTSLHASERKLYGVRVVEYGMGLPCEIYSVYETEEKLMANLSRINPRKRGWETIHESTPSKAAVEQLLAHVTSVDTSKLASWHNNRVMDGSERRYEFFFTDESLVRIFVSNSYNPYYAKINELVNAMFPSEHQLYVPTGKEKYFEHFELFEKATDVKPNKLVP